MEDKAIERVEVEGDEGGGGWQEARWRSYDEAEVKILVRREFWHLGW
jgi:hypothetical protein